jgi:hypothetical protein
MIKQFAQMTVVATAMLAASCGGSPRDDDTARVTIDMRCASNADCPRGFTCAAEDEHGPPTTMCESEDPAASCPRDYETRVGHGQVFCIPRFGHRGHGAVTRAARLSHEPASPVELQRTR